jgi:5-methylcytosine-specific restriction endonuclease McrA
MQLFDDRIEAQRKRQRAYYERNKQKVIDAAKAWKLANPEKVKEGAKIYRFANAAQITALQGAWSKRNPDKIKAKSKRYYDSHTDKVRAKSSAYHGVNKSAINEKARAYKQKPEYRARAHTYRERRESGLATGQLSKGIVTKLLRLQKGLCPCCKNTLGDAYHLDHIMPLSRGGANVDENVQLLRQECNLNKHAKHPVDFMQERGHLL